MVFADTADAQGLVKVINACFAPFNRYWNFVGALTDQEVHLNITDTKTNASKLYNNALKTAFQPIQDTTAFSTCP